jgi:hypothetical protein
MQFYKSLIHFGIVGTSIVLASLPVQAAIITYTDRDAFLAALSSSSTDNYSDLTSGFLGTSINRTIPGYTYTASAPNGIFPGPVNGTGSMALSINTANDVLTLNFATGAPTAVGGYFFATDINVNLLNRSITVTANPGASTQSVVTGSATNFFGWLDDSGTPFTSLAIVTNTGDPASWPNADDLVLGKAAPAAPASVPGPLPLMGAATAFGFSRRLRSRIAAARPRA